MKTIRLITLIALIAFLPSAALQAQEPVSIDQFAWLTGHWIGDGFGGVSEEIWSEPKDGVIIGLYRHLDKGKNNFYEFITISENEEGGVNFRLKHFNPDMTAWEDKEDFVDFPFVSVEPGKAIFKGLVYELEDEKTLKVRLKLRNKEKSWEEVFTFRRSDPFPATTSRD